ncbi:MAG: THUMP domain-containing protein [Thaumarchaeota archaeon]|nr:THUMP domain-containing protein [Nitrososphaerota archaeon]
MNLIVTCSRHLEEEASGEILKTLAVLGDSDARAGHSRFSGIVMVDTSLDPFEAINKIREKILDEPWCIRYCHRFIPIQEATRAGLNDIVLAVQNHINKMGQDDSFRITIEKRGSELSTKDIIDSIANIVKNKVSLEEYDWNIIVEILGDIAGVSILKEDEIVSTMKLKRDLVE